MSGYISERSVDIGTLVGPNGKSLLATVVKSDTVRVDFSMTATRLPAKARPATSTWARRTPPASGTPTSPSRWPTAPSIRCRGLVDFADPQVDPRDGNLLRARRDAQPRPHPAARTVHEGAHCCSTCAKTPRSWLDQDGPDHREGRRLRLRRAARTASPRRRLDRTRPRKRATTGSSSNADVVPRARRSSSRAIHKLTHGDEGRTRGSS